jgi:hypothetical protein
MQKIRNEIHEIWIKVDLPSCFQVSSSKLQIMLPKPNFVPKFPRTRQTKNLETWVKVRLSWTWQTTIQFLLFFFYCKLSFILSLIHHTHHVIVSMSIYFFSFNTTNVTNHILWKSSNFLLSPNCFLVSMFVLFQKTFQFSVEFVFIQRDSRFMKNITHQLIYTT